MADGLDNESIINQIINAKHTDQAYRASNGAMTGASNNGAMTGASNGPSLSERLTHAASKTDIKGTRSWHLLDTVVHEDL